MKKVIVGINSKYIHPSFGIYQIKANFASSIDIIEVNIKDNIDSLISKIIQYELIAFSAYIWNIELIKQILSKLDNDKIVVIGGPEASYSVLDLFKYPSLKYIIKGEGEEAFNELYLYLQNKIPIEEVSNLYYRKDNEIKYTYNKLPNILNIKHDYSLNRDIENRISYIESSRGCYFSCTYCLASTEKPVREFPIEEVLTNLKYLLDNKAKIIKFLDRSFNINEERTLQILSFIKENDNNYSTFQFEIVGDRISDQIISLLKTMRKKSIRFEIGIQSTNPKTMEAIKRKQDFDRIRKVILELKDYVVIHTDLICGLPYEDLTAFKKSFNETFLLFTEELQLGFLKELKGTEISQTKDKYKYLFSPTAPFEVIHNEYITNEELNEVKYVEKAVDKLYNYSKYQNTFNYLFNELKLNPYDTFLNISKYIEENSSFRSQIKDLSKALYLSLIDRIDDKDKLLYLIKIDYLTLSKVRPAIWWEQTITRGERNYIYQKISNIYNKSIDELYNYGRLEKYKNEYFLILYPSKEIITYTSTLAPCGFDCINCPIYNKGCNGCNSNNLYSFCLNCLIRQCVKDRNYANCSNCQNYSCDKLNNISIESKKLLDSLRK